MSLERGISPARPSKLEKMTPNPMTRNMAAVGRRRRLCLAGIALVSGIAGGAVLLGGAVASTSALPVAPLSTLGQLQPAPAAGPLGPEGAPIPAKAALLARPASKATLTRSVDGIKCQPSEKVLFHIHAHLSVFVNGKPRLVPYGIGIGPPLSGQNTSSGAFVTNGSCFSWLHTHVSDGIIHIESPVKRTFRLGELFDIWGQPLSTSRVGPAHGHVVALFNGQVYKGDPRQIPLLGHAQIQLDVGTPLVAPESIVFRKPL